MKQTSNTLPEEAKDEASGGVRDHRPHGRVAADVVRARPDVHSDRALERLDLPPELRELDAQVEVAEREVKRL
jgi:hypothetical protein